NPGLAHVRFGLATKGLTVSAGDGGTLLAKDASGDTVFTSPAAMMWDSSPGEGRHALVGVSVSKDGLTVSPDAAMLDDPHNQFPLFIDPQWNGGLSGNAWTMVWSRSDTQNSSF